jgi:hypothetical protein
MILKIAAVVPRARGLVQHDVHDHYHDHVLS